MNQPGRSVLVSIRGRVQGVGYRAWTVRQATALGLRGWVRNEADGSVTAMIGGTDEAVTRMLGLLLTGPLAARVYAVAEQPADDAELPADFRETR